MAAKEKSGSFAYADEDPPPVEDDNMQTRRRDVVESQNTVIGAHGNQHQPVHRSLPVEDNQHEVVCEAWNKLWFNIDRNGTKDTYDATKSIEPCKIQFIMDSPVANVDFFARLDMELSMKVMSPGCVIVDIDSSTILIETFWQTLLLTINSALQDKVVKSHTFASEQELEMSLHDLDTASRHLLHRRLVRVYAAVEENMYVAKFVGTEIDTKKIVHALNIKLSVNDHKETVDKLKKSAVLPVHTSSNISRISMPNKVFKDERRCSIDIINYLETMKYKQHLQEQCPTVMCGEAEHDHTRYQITSSNEQAVKQAMSLLDSYISRIQKIEVQLNPGDISFIQGENVKIHLMIQLKAVPAHISISDKVHVWCEGSEKLSQAKEMVYDSYETATVEGNMSPEAQSIVDASHGKIKIDGNNSSNVKLRYTKDLSADAKDLADIIQKSRCRLDKYYDQLIIKALIALRMTNDLIGGFNDVNIQVLEKLSAIRLQGPSENRLRDASRELEVHVERIKVLPLKNLPRGAEELLTNDTVMRYVQAQLGNINVAFIQNDNHEATIVCLSPKTDTHLLNCVKNCFIPMSMKTDYFETTQGHDFLEMHRNEIFREAGYICFTERLRINIDELQTCYSGDCNGIVAEFLKTHGSSNLINVGKRHNVVVELNEGHILFKGRYNDGEKAMRELEEYIAMEILHLEDYRNILESEEARKKADDIADHYRCSWGIVGCSTYPPENNGCRGIEYLTTWILHDKQGSISVADIDYKTAELDVLIIPVNTCMYGEDVLMKEPAEISYGNYCSKGKVPIGEWRMWKSDGKLGCKYCVAIITSDVVVASSEQSKQVISNEKLYTCITDVFHKLFIQKLYKVGFAIASTNSDIKSKLNVVLAGFRQVAQQFGDILEIELLLSVKSETERLWWIKKIDRGLKVQCTRRHVFPKVYGFFSKPNVKTTITEKSILEVGADCIAVAISRDMNLSRGLVSQLISQAAGWRLQEDLYNRHKDELERGELVLADSMDLSKKGVKTLIFGYLPLWKYCERSTKIIETFVLDSLLLADSANCTSVAFPALGTGKLGFPLRDVSMSLLDGIDRYMEEAPNGYISAVNIAVPKLNDDSMSQLLSIEHKRREEKKDVNLEAMVTEDIPFLIANDDNVTIAIMKESTKDELLSGNIAMQKSTQDMLSSSKFVDIIFKPTHDMDNGGTDVDQSLWKIIISCHDSKDGLRQAMKNAISICENRKITSIYIHSSDGFSFAESGQTDIIIGTVQQTILDFDVGKYPVRTYMYLKNVTVVTSDHAFPSIADVLTQSKGGVIWPLFNNPTTTLEWRKRLFQRANMFVNVMLAGGERSQLEKAKQDIKQLTSQLHGNTVSDRCTESEEVRAELNPGIIKHLMSVSASYYDSWKNHVSMAFGIEVVDAEIHNPTVIIRGLFDNILKMEHYLENKFPALPEIDEVKSKNDQIKFQEQHFQAEPFTSLSVPISDKEKRRLINIFPGDISNLTAHVKVRTFSVHEGMIKVLCAPEIKKELALTIEALREKIKNTVVRKITVFPTITLSDVFSNNVKNLPDGVMLEENEEEHAISIVGLEQKTVKQVRDGIEGWLKKMMKKGPITGIPYSLKSSIFEFNTLKVTVCCQDITTTEVDCIVSAVNEKLNCEFGVAKDIAKKAGKRYVAECKASMDYKGYLPYTECRATGPGHLKYKNILHVHCPIKFDQTQMLKQLIALQTSVTHCVQLAEELGLASIAIPFLCTGISGFPIEHCAQEYFKAFADFRQAKFLREVQLVDINEQKVSDVCDVLSRCTRGQGDTVFQTAMQLTLGGNNGMKIYIGPGNVYSIVTEAVVVIEDQKCSGKGKQEKHILQCAGPHVKHMLNELRNELRGQAPVTSVTSIRSDGELPSKYVMFAVPPVWNDDKTNFTKLVRITTQHILEEACGLGVSKLALPILCFEDELIVTNVCCMAMAETILEFRKNKCTVNDLQILSEDKRAISKMCHTLAVQLHHGDVRAPMESRNRETVV